MTFKLIKRSAIIGILIKAKFFLSLNRNFFAFLKSFRRCRDDVGEVIRFISSVRHSCYLA
jgi:hypothetical protein